MLKRFSLVVTVAGLLALSLCAPASAQSTGQDSAVGIYADPFLCSGFICVRNVAAPNARSGPSGEDPSGTAPLFVQGAHGAVTDGPRPVADGAVTCLNVVGNRAAIGLALTYKPQFAGSGLPRFATLIVEDNGASGDESAMTTNGEAVSTCPDPTTGFGLQPISAGGITVHDVLTPGQARATCRAERRSLGPPAFRAKYGNPGRAMRNCIGQKTS